MSYSALWSYDLETKIFSKIKAKLTSKLKTKYAGLNVTMDGKDDTKAKFPTVFVQFIVNQEYGNTLENDLINAVKLEIQIDVTVPKIQGISVIREVSGAVIEAMKSMYFNVTMPMLDFDSDDTIRTVSRFDRVVGQGDNI